MIGQFLIETLKDGMGDKFTKETENAWIKIYGHVANQMKLGMHGAKIKK